MGDGVVLFGAPDLLDPEDNKNYLELNQHEIAVISEAPLRFQRVNEETQIGEAYVFGPLYPGGYVKLAHHDSEGGSIAFINPFNFTGLKDETINRIMKYFNSGEVHSELLQLRLTDPEIIWIGSVGINGYADLYVNKNNNIPSIIVDSGCFFGVEEGMKVLVTEIKKEFRRPFKLNKPPVNLSPTSPIKTFTKAQSETVPPHMHLARFPQNPETPVAAPITPFGSPIQKIGNHQYDQDKGIIKYRTQFYLPKGQNKKAQDISLTPGEAEKLESQIINSLSRYENATVMIIPETNEAIIEIPKSDFDGEAPEEIIKDIKDTFKRAEYMISRKGIEYLIHVR